MDKVQNIIGKPSRNFLIFALILKILQHYNFCYRNGYQYICEVDRNVHVFAVRNSYIYVK
jgi:hypothetical protein